MSDQSQGESWWVASDGKWYPPPRPDVPAQPTTEPLAGEQPTRSGLGRGPIIGIAVALVVLVAAVAFFLTRDDDKTQNASVSKVIEDDASGVSIAVPTDFDQIDPSQFDNTESQSAFSGADPDLAPFLSSGNAFLQNSVLAASGSVNGTPALVVVGKSPQRFDPTDTELASGLQSALQSQLAAVGDSEILLDTVALPAGEALRVRVTLDVNTGSSSGTIHETIFFVTVGRTTWAILGVSVGDPASDLFGQVAETFAVKS